VGEPAGEFRLQGFPQIGTNIQVAHPRSAAQPLQNAATSEIYMQRFHIDRDRAQRLKSIQHHVRAYSVGLLDDCFRVLYVGASKDHMRNRNEQGLFVNRVQQSLEGNRDPVVGLYHVDAGPVSPLRLPEIHHGRKVHVGVDDLVALA